MAVRAIRGATQLDVDEREHLLERSAELVKAVLEANDLENEDLISILFTVTSDLRSEFPAVAGRQIGLTDVPLEGAHAVVIGRSPILGKPAGMLLLASNATVTYAHSRTRDLPELVRTADVVIAAVGKANFVRGDWLKPGAVVVDAGYNEGNVGDVHFAEAAEVARLITPVPGGVGPMTIALLLEQTVDAAETAVHSLTTLA